MTSTTHTPTNVDPQVQDPAAAEEAARLADEERQQRELRRERLRLFGGVDVTDVTICIGYKDATGARHEVIRTVQDGAEFRITKCNHAVEEKMVAKKDSGDIVGYEPTGQYHIKLDVSFVRN